MNMPPEFTTNLGNSLATDPRMKRNITAIICWRKTHLLHARAAFGDQYVYYQMCENPAGLRLDKIIILHPCSLLSRNDEERFEEQKVRWLSRLSPDGEYHLV